jgi:hypothetical protein
MGGNNVKKILVIMKTTVNNVVSILFTLEEFNLIGDPTLKIGGHYEK